MLGNIVVIAILIVIMFFALRGSFKHLKGEGGCCGGSSTIKIKGEKLKHVDGIKEIQIEGMTCNHCKQRIENALNTMKHVSAKVNLKKKKAIIKFSGDLSNELVKEVIEDLGYKVSQIK